MAVDWESLNKEIEASADRTKERLADRISSLTRMTEDEIQDLLPEEADKEKMVRLMTIVRSSDEHNKKVSNLISNIEELGGIVLSLLDKFV